MLYSEEEMQRRKQEREALKKQRMEEQKRFKRRMIFAAVALAVAAAALVTLALTSRKETSRRENPTQGSTTLDTSPTLPTEAPAKKGKTVIHFAAAGDVTVTDRVAGSGGDELNYAPVITDVLPLLGDADLTAINLESTMVGSPYGATNKSLPTALLRVLKNAGVDMVQVANSYSISNGITGLGMTLQNLRSVGLVPVGAYATNEEAVENGGYTIWEVQGVRVAVVGFTKGMNNFALPENSEKCVNLLYKDYYSTYKKINTEGITDILKRVQKEKPDLTVALVHWGSEYNDTQGKTQLAIRDLLLENGVDAIIGTHPHYVQKVEFDKKNGTVVAYSLGDFIADGTEAGTDYAITLDLEITKDNKSGETRITDYTVTPIYKLVDEDGHLRIVRIKEAMTAYEMDYLDKVTAEEYGAMKHALERIESRVKGK